MSYYFYFIFFIMADSILEIDKLRMKAALLAGQNDDDVSDIKYGVYGEKEPEEILEYINSLTINQLKKYIKYRDDY